MPGGNERNDFASREADPTTDDIDYGSEETGNKLNLLDVVTKGGFDQYEPHEHFVAANAESGEEKLLGAIEEALAKHESSLRNSDRIVSIRHRVQKAIADGRPLDYEGLTD